MKRNKRVVNKSALKTKINKMTQPEAVIFILDELQSDIEYLRQMKPKTVGKTLAVMCTHDIVTHYKELMEWILLHSEG